LTTRLLTTITALRQLLAEQREIGFVPTMGALHQGHLSLIQRARAENSCVVVSIFVNPLQFAVGEDYERYPRNLEADQALCAQAGVDVIFAPTPEALGLDRGQLTQVVPDKSLTEVLCGRSRVGHFTGVATIVTMLLNIVRPHRLYLGQKDAQQLAIIQKLVADLCLPVEVIPCPTIREPNGLACSSRNLYLTAPERQIASHLYRGLQRAQSLFEKGVYDRSSLVAAVQQEVSAYPELQVEYIDLVDSTTLEPLQEISLGTSALLAIAAFIGKTRLIDNVILHRRLPIIAIDGPAGAGKSTVTSLVAKEVGLLHLDTGAMYRAITLAVLQAGIDPQDTVSVAEIAARAKIEIRPTHPAQILLNGIDVSQEIRSSAVTKAVAAIASQPAVRQILLSLQRSWGKRGGIVMEGRDIGTRIFPCAELKIFLTASVAERAMRRYQQLTQQGEVSDLESLKQAIQERDLKDSTRPVSPLRQAEDAIRIDTDGLTVAEVVARIVNLYAERTQLRAK